MGGVIAVTIRLPDGTEHRMERWTNVLPDLFSNPEFLRGNPKSVNEFILHWQTESAKKNKGDTIISSWKMYENPYLAPSEYGVLVIDFMKKLIIDCQGYLDTTTIMDIEAGFKELKKAGFIGKIVYQDKPKYKGIPPMTVYEIKHPFWTILKTKSFKDARQKILDQGFVITPNEEKIWRKTIRERRSP